MGVTVLILACDEALHIVRAIRSCAGFATRVVVVDSGSRDATVALARQAGAEVWQAPWPGYAVQFNRALARLNEEGEDDGWVLRLDADEVVTPALAAEIAAGLPPACAGLTLRREIRFLGAPVRFGGVGGMRQLRLIRAGRGRCEARHMDEHLLVEGAVGALDGAIVDDNLKPLDWWLEKHAGYAAREAADLDAAERGPLPSERGAALRRWIKLHLYARLPPGWRAGLYFLYRYFLRGGFRDGPEGRAYHVLQGFWYRYLVDLKLRDRRARALSDAQDRPRARREDPVMTSPNSPTIARRGPGDGASPALREVGFPCG